MAKKKIEPDSSQPFDPDAHLEYESPHQPYSIPNWEGPTPNADPIPNYSGDPFNDRARKPNAIWMSAIRGMGQGASFGFADEAAAGIVSMMGDEDYETVVERYREMERQAREDNPNSYAIGELVGGITSSIAPGAGLLRAGKGMSTLGRIGLGVAEGGAQGALEGYGYSEGDDTMGMVGRGTILGAGLGGAMPLVGKGLSELVKKVKKGRQMDDWIEAADDFEDAVQLKHKDLTPEQIKKVFADYRADNKRTSFSADESPYPHYESGAERRTTTVTPKNDMTINIANRKDTAQVTFNTRKVGNSVLGIQSTRFDKPISLEEFFDEGREAGFTEFRSLPWLNEDEAASWITAANRTKGAEIRVFGEIQSIPSVRSGVGDIELGDTDIFRNPKALDTQRNNAPAIAIQFKARGGEHFDPTNLRQFNLTKGLNKDPNYMKTPFDDMGDADDLVRRGKVADDDAQGYSENAFTKHGPGTGKRFDSVRPIGKPPTKAGDRIDVPKKYTPEQQDMMGDMMNAAGPQRLPDFEPNLRARHKQLEDMINSEEFQMMEPLEQQEFLEMFRKVNEDLAPFNKPKAPKAPDLDSPEARDAFDRLQKFMATDNFRNLSEAQKTRLWDLSQDMESALRGDHIDLSKYKETKYEDIMGAGGADVSAGGPPIPPTGRPTLEGAPPPPPSGAPPEEIADFLDELLRFMGPQAVQVFHKERMQSDERYRKMMEIMTMPGPTI